MGEVGVSKKEALQRIKISDGEIDQLLMEARSTRYRFCGAKVHLCAIINARSGKCSEDCAFCAQSSWYRTGAPEYPVISAEEALAKAKRMVEVGVERFSLVTSGGKLSRREFKKILDIFEVLKKEVPSLSFCASLGSLDKERAAALKEVGVTTYHHNIETSRTFYSRICTTHTFDSRIETIRIAQEAGLEVCSGGIFGMGESEEDRIDMMFILKDANISSVPINILNPIPGTPLADQPPLPVGEILKTLGVFRLVFPSGILRLCGGRERALGSFQRKALETAINGLMVGNYLTTKGNPLEEDLKMVHEVEHSFSMGEDYTIGGVSGNS
ncbi:MAG: biotin synthase BioB [Syntrophobacterales bacterium]|nr:biotin synthase BioB [Syntrophobacterales bacterium]